MDLLTAANIAGGLIAARPIIKALPLARVGNWQCGFTYPWWLDPWGSAKLARVSTCWWVW